MQLDTEVRARRGGDPFSGLLSDACDGVGRPAHRTPTDQDFRTSVSIGRSIRLYANLGGQASEQIGESNLRPKASAQGSELEESPVRRGSVLAMKLIWGFEWLPGRNDFGERLGGPTLSGARRGVDGGGCAREHPKVRSEEVSLRNDRSGLGVGRTLADCPVGASLVPLLVQIRARSAHF